MALMEKNIIKIVEKQKALIAQLLDGANTSREAAGLSFSKIKKFQVLFMTPNWTFRLTGRLPQRTAVPHLRFRLVWEADETLEAQKKKNKVRIKNEDFLFNLIKKPTKIIYPKPLGW